MTVITGQQAIGRSWRCASGLRATLTHYPAAGRHAPHAHDLHQISFVLAGRLEERVEGRSWLAASGMRGGKPAGARHSDAWGAEGALVFTLHLEDTSGAHFEPGWAPLPSHSQVAALIRHFVRGDGESREEAAHDLIALDTGAASAEAPPHWLECVREAMHDSRGRMTVAEMAAGAEVHRAHLARLFRHHYGVPPSLYRRRVLIGRAAEALARTDVPVAGIAADAGFCDQSHLSRALVAELGLTPARLRALLGRRHPSNPGAAGLC
jgi:AraC family transcriptional regulator